MSNKHFRRLAKEDDLLVAINKDNNDETAISEESDGEVEKIKINPINKFALLDDEDQGQDDSASEPSDADVEAAAPSNSEPKKIRKKNKKKPKKKEIGEIELHENNDAKAISVAASKKEAVMKIDPRLLDPDMELRRLLGRTFGPAGANEGGRASHSRALRISRLVKVQPNWPKTGSLGLSMCLHEENNGVKYFRFKHNRDYQELQQIFWNFQAHLDFENIMHTVLEVNPFHLDALLLVSENLRIHDDTNAAINILEMGIFACERAFHPNFRPFSLDCRLSYDWWENRAFFLLLNRYLLTLIQRNCFTTALEFAKIIFIRDDNDPLAILLMIDSLALRAKNYKFLLDFYDAYKDERNLNMLPNFLYSMALANFFLSESDERYAEDAEKFMVLALSRFPFILGQILDKLQIQADSSVENNSLLNTLAFHRETEGLQLISRIYLHHSIELWRLPGVLLWLEQTTHKILPQLSNDHENLRATVNSWRKKRKECFVGIPRNVLRHAQIHSIHQEFIANNVVAGSHSSDIDPFPPPNSQADYVSEVSTLNPNEGVNNSYVGNNTLVEFVRTLVPDEIQPQLQQFGEALRGYVAGFVNRLSGNH